MIEQAMRIENRIEQFPEKGTFVHLPCCGSKVFIPRVFRSVVACPDCDKTFRVSFAPLMVKELEGESNEHFRAGVCGPHQEGTLLPA